MIQTEDRFAFCTLLNETYFYNPTLFCFVFSIFKLRYILHTEKSPFLVHSSAHFDKHTQTCNYHHNQDIEQFHHPSEFLVHLCSQPSSLHSNPWQQLIQFLPIQLSLSSISWEQHQKAFLSLSISHLRFIYVIVWLSNLFPFYC